MFNILQDLKGEREGVIKERNRFEAILASIGNGVFAIDITGKIILANKVMHTMSGKESLLGDNYHSVFKFNIEGRTNEPPLEIIEESISTGEIKILPINAVLIRLDERIIPIGGSVSPIKDAEGIIIGAVVVVRDVSLERQLEHAKSDFLSIAAHQLRTPLGSMRWNLELLLGGDYGKIPEEANSVIAQISEGNKWLLALVNDLLDVSRLDQGKIKNVVMETLIAPIIANVVSENEMAAHTKDIRILSPITVKPFHPVMVDPDLFHEVITNIVSNAVKYSLKGGVIEVDGEERDGKIKIWVKDSGIGIPEKDYGRMFDKFFRARNAVHSETVGSGLGLFVVKTYVELWNGRVWFESKEGVGTTFFIELPIKK
jgi:PAS domain S-box-containing protein